jgi:hypothetical protein
MNSPQGEFKFERNLFRHWTVPPISAISLYHLTLRVQTFKGIERFKPEATENGGKRLDLETKPLGPLRNEGSHKEKEDYHVNISDPRISHGGIP